MAFGRLRDLFKPKEFPEKGQYKGVAYRIDGDSVMLCCSTGEEIEFSPSADFKAEEFDDIRLRAAAGKSEDANLSSWDSPPNIDDKSMSGTRNAVSSDASFERVAKAYDIDIEEYEDLGDIANEIMIRHWRSKARFAKK